MRIGMDSFITSLLFYTGVQCLTRLYSNSVNMQRTVVSFINTASLSTFSGFSLYLFYLQDHDAINRVLSLPHFTQLADLLVGNFLVDLIIGHFYDRAKLYLLEGYIHHILYIASISYIRSTGESNLILLYLPFEIPTVFLNLNRLIKDRPFDIPFGVTFLLFRIIYNVWLLFIMAKYNIAYMALTTLMLGVHSYWYSKWLKRYLLK